MGPNSCSVCGRPRPAGLNGPRLESGLPVHLWERADAGWAVFEAGDVCPECQTAAQRRQVALRLVGMIEREIERRQTDKIAPEPYEAALVAYAMALRESAGVDADEAEDTSRTDPAMRGGPGEEDVRATAEPVNELAGADDGLTLRVAITGAFLTGHALHVRLEEFQDRQRQLGGVLNAQRWRTEGLLDRGGTYDSGGGFSEDVPLVIVRRDGKDLLASLACALRDAGDAAGETVRSVATVKVSPRRLAIDVYDLGVAVMTAWLDVTSDEAELEHVLRAVKQLAWLRPVDGRRSPFAEELQRISTETAAEYGRALAATTPTGHDRGSLANWLQPSGPVPTDAPPHERTRLLWLHPVFVLSTAGSCERAVSRLAAPFHETCRLDGGFFAPGIESSAIAVHDPTSACPALRVTQLHWAYYALYMNLDRRLLDTLNEPRWARPKNLRDVEGDADRMFEYHQRVMNARARLDCALTARGGDELSIWKTIAKVQGFDEVVGSVERKLDVLDNLAKRRVDQAATLRARRIADTLGYLSCFGLVTLIIAVLGATVGAPPSRELLLLWRVLIAALAVAAAVALAWHLFLRSPPVSTSSRRPPDT